MTAPESDAADLLDIVDSVLSAHSTISAAEQRIAGLPPPGARRQFWELELDQLNNRISHEERPATVALLGRLAAAAAAALDLDPATAHLAAGKRLAQLGSPDQALPHLEIAERLLRRDGRPEAATVGLMEVQCLTEVHRLVDAESFAVRLVGAARQSESRANLAEALFVQSFVSDRRRDREVALRAAREALQLRRALTAEELADRDVFAEVLFWERAGLAARHAGCFEEALADFEQGRTAALRNSDRQNAAHMLSETAITWEVAGDSQRSAEILEQAAQEVEALGDDLLAQRWRKSVPAVLPLTAQEPADLLALAAALFRSTPPRLADAIDPHQTGRAARYAGAPCWASGRAIASATSKGLRGAEP